MAAKTRKPKPGEVWYRVSRGNDAHGTLELMGARCLGVRDSWVTWGNSRCGDQSWKEQGWKTGVARWCPTGIGAIADFCDFHAVTVSEKKMRALSMRRTEESVVQEARAAILQGLTLAMKLGRYVEKQAALQGGEGG